MIRRMKPRILLPLAIAAFLLAGCSGSANSDGNGGGGGDESSSTTEQEAPPAEPLDLSGEWKQTNSNSRDSYQAATISGDTITIDWVNEAESTTALYWVGTYEAPTEDTDTHAWTSVGDVEQMETALMASGDDSKDFTYENGVLMYELTALGVTMTVEMEKQ